MATNANERALWAEINRLKLIQDRLQARKSEIEHTIDDVDKVLLEILLGIQIMRALKHRSNRGIDAS
jgi:hypothetical protein